MKQKRTLMHLALLLLRPEAERLDKMTLEGDIPVEDWMARCDELVHIVSLELGIDPGSLRDKSGLENYLTDETDLRDDTSQLLYELENNYLWLTWQNELQDVMIADECIDLMTVSVFLSALWRNPFEMSPDELRATYEATNRQQEEAQDNPEDVLKPYREMLMSRLRMAAAQQGIPI